MDMALFGQRLKSRRELSGVSVPELAELIGVNKATIYRYEKGDFNSIKLATVEKIADALHCPADWLIGKSQDPGLVVVPAISLTRLTKEEAQNLDIVIPLLDDMIQQDAMYVNGEPLNDNERTVLHALLNTAYDLIKDNHLK